MKILLVTLIIGFSTALPSSKIVGGEPTNITAVPYIVSYETLEIIHWAHTCGGSIVSRNAVVTAAHCVVFNSPSLIRFRAGTTEIGKGGSIHQASNITIHPLFKFSNKDYDIAFITVVEPFEFDDYEQPVKMPESEPRAGDVSLIAGWGVTNEGNILPVKTLESAEVPIADRKECQEEYGNADFTPRMICVGSGDGGEDSCLFDSGGPVLINGSLVGIISHGEKGCGLPNQYKLDTNVAYFKDWVAEQIRNSI